MNKPKMSDHYKSRKPSPIRLAQIEFSKRNDKVKAINLAIGNVSLPMHPKMIDRMKNLINIDSPFKDGSVRYTETKGTKEVNAAFMNIIESSGFSTNNLHSVVTDGGSHAIELAIVGTCGDDESEKSPLLLIDASYTNYMQIAKRLRRRIVSIRRDLEDHGKFTLPKIDEIEKTIKKQNPKAMVVIPYDNPTGHFYDHETLIKLAKLCVENNMWMISDEAYRELHYIDHDPVSIWGITDTEVPGIIGRRISIESASKVWNACGLRIGALITDNKEFHNATVAEQTANLSANAIGQYIFGALAHESKEELNNWYAKLRKYYKDMMTSFTQDIKKELPNIIVSSPDASIYSVLDVKNIVKKGFDAEEFVLFCAKYGKANINNEEYTLLTSPMAGFYNMQNNSEENPGKTQLRLAYVVSPDNMKKVPRLFIDLLNQYEQK